MAKKSKKKGGTPIVAINRATENTFVLDGNIISNYEISKSSKKKEFFITYIPYREIVTTNVEINRATPDNEIADAITIKTYEDLSLDPSADYKITYLETPSSSGDSRYYNVFAINNTILSGDLEPIANHTKYIDYVAKAPFLMGALYKRNIVVPAGVDCFVYLQKDDAFLAIYQNGEYFESRPIRYNLKFIHDKYTELTGNRVPEEDFYNDLSKKGVNISDEPVIRDYMIQIFDEMIFYIGDITNGISKINNIKIDNMYFGTDIGDIPGVEVFIQDRLGFNYRVFDFSVAINQKDFDLTQLDVLMMLMGQEYILSKDDSYNYTPFGRPPPLNQRESGKFLGICALAFVAAMAYPIYQYGYGFYNQKIAEKTEEEFAIKDKERTRVESALASLQQQIDNTIKSFEEQNGILTKRSDTLDAMFDKKVNYPMRSRAVYDISGMVNSNEGMLTRVESNDDNMTFSVRTQTEKKMTELLKNISATDGYSVDTKSIILDENNATVAYESNVSVNVGVKR